METFNQALYLIINAPEHANPFVVGIATIFALYAIWLAPLTLIAGWFRGDETIRRQCVEAALSTGIALLAAQVIGFVWPHPRPFMLGLGTNLLAHSPDSSFPSDHLTCLWTVAFSLVLHGRTRRAGIALALLGLPMAWARIYLGVHFPLDIVGAALLSWASASVGSALCKRPVAWLVATAPKVYGPLIAPLVRRGGVARNAASGTGSTREP